MMLYPETVEILCGLRSQIQLLLNSEQPSGQDVAKLISRLRVVDGEIGNLEFFGGPDRENDGGSENIGEVCYHFHTDFGDPSKIIGKKWRDGARVIINPGITIPEKGIKLLDLERKPEHK